MMKQLGFNQTQVIRGILLGMTIALSGGVQAAGTCSLSTLKGYYVFNSYGNVNSEEYSESGHEIFDGKGNVTGQSIDKSGVNQKLVGRYTVDRSCVGSITYTQPEASTETIFLGPKGDVFTYIQAGDGDVISGTETRQGK